MQPPKDTRIQNPPGTPGWMEALAIVILFATLSFGGFLWWPFFVGAVLVVCLAYWYFFHIRKVR